MIGWQLGSIGLSLTADGSQVWMKLEIPEQNIEQNVVSWF